MSKYLYLTSATTGLKANEHALINLTGKIYHKEIQQNEFAINFKPLPNQKINSKAMKINRLTKEKLKDFPEPLESVKKFKKYLTAPFILVGFNLKFLKSFIEELDIEFPALQFFNSISPIEIDLQFIFNHLNQLGVLKDEHWVKYKSLANIFNVFYTDFEIQEGLNFQGLQNLKLRKTILLHQKFEELAKKDYPQISKFFYMDFSHDTDFMTGKEAIEYILENLDVPTKYSLASLLSCENLKVQPIQINNYLNGLKISKKVALRFFIVFGIIIKDQYTPIGKC